jgi:lycopene beta-cyclase
MKKYDYIFLGAGLSSLMNVYEMILFGKFQDKSVLLLDKNSKKNNDRTWCFWDESDLFSAVVSKEWQTAFFANTNFEKNISLNPYRYKMIQGLDFYNFIFDSIFKHPNIHFLNESVIDFQDLGNHCVVKTATETYSCDKIFNSIFNPELLKKQIKYPLLQQHFIGWFVKIKETVFNPNVATFMDFSVAQKGNTRFMYVLPTSTNEALVEYTLFSKDLLEIVEYENAIKDYLSNLGVTDYKIIAKEQGNIPMTCYPFWKHNTKNVIHIGSAGGWTKASTGFTFKNTIKKSKKLISFLSQENDFRKFHKKNKFWFYDLLFIEVLHKDNHEGSNVFSALFRKGNPILIFKFLDEETTFYEDLQVMLKCPKRLFIKALWKTIFNKAL